MISNHKTSVPNSGCCCMKWSRQELFLATYQLFCTQCNRLLHFANSKIIIWRNWNYNSHYQEKNKKYIRRMFLLKRVTHKWGLPIPSKRDHKNSVMFWCLPLTVNKFSLILTPLAQNLHQIMVNMDAIAFYKLSMSFCTPN